MFAAESNVPGLQYIIFFSSAPQGDHLKKMLKNGANAAPAWWAAHGNNPPSQLRAEDGAYLMFEEAAQ